MKKLLIAGASGYLGKYLVKQAKEQGYWVRVILRDKNKALEFEHQADEVQEAQATNPKDLPGCCDSIDWVISSLGITRQKGFRYVDVDFGANKNVLEQALQSKVKGFTYVSVFNGERLRWGKGVGAKEKFVDLLKDSAIQSSIIRPTGFFSDMLDLYRMVEQNKVWLFGKGDKKLNPIHGNDLAKAIIESLDNPPAVLNIGGPKTYTHLELIQEIQKILDKKVKIRFMPDWIRKLTLALLPVFTPERFYGPVQFFLSAMGVDSNAPEYGKEALEEFFRQQKASKNGSYNSA
jgi:uncharacterized protein YbjT (DUF2867 family)